MKYSDLQLQEFKKLIEKKLASAQEAYNLLKDEISKKDSNGANDTNWSFSIDDGDASLAMEEKNTLAAKQQKFIDSLQAALIRIQNKTYGICVKTGVLIPKERLLAVPGTTVCINAKNQ